MRVAVEGVDSKDKADHVDDLRTGVPRHCPLWISEYHERVLFMVVERFRDAGARPVYERARAQGRMTPDGLRYVDSWVDASLRRCFQLMECDDLTLLTNWISHWADLVDFEVIPVITSAQASVVIHP
jgi:hypothetical protein